MFFRILKKDLNRKKVMNVILLLFVILCSMFASASVNNIIAVTNGIEQYFDAANVPEVTVELNGPDDTIEDEIKALSSVKEVKASTIGFITSSKNFTHNGKQLENFVASVGFISEEEMAINYYDTDNNIIKSVEKGTFYATGPFSQDTDIKPGDMVTLEVGETKLELKYMGRFKGALFSNEKSSNPFILIDSGDYDTLYKEEDTHNMQVICLFVYTSDIAAVKDTVKDHYYASAYARADYKSVYLYDMIAAYIMMAISVILMITAFVVLRFTIGFTISEEFREIGVMKAVGINNGSIRSLYIVKYLAISVIGAAIGFIGSVPLTKMMLNTVSKNMVLGSSHSLIMGAVSSAAVVAVILLFCYGCTRKVRKLSPIDAVRSGQTGERFHKKTIMDMSRSKLPSTMFLASNDLLSSPKRFGIITVIFCLCLQMVMLMSTFAVTLKSEKIFWLFAAPKSEAHILDMDMLNDLLKDSSSLNDKLEDIEKKLADNGIPGTCTSTVSFLLDTQHNDKKSKINYFQIKGKTEDTIPMDEGSAPQKNDEIAVTVSTMKALDAKIGDRITASINGEDHEFIITGTFSTFGVHCAMLNKDFPSDGLPINGCMGFQIHFSGDPDQAAVDSNIETMKDIMGTDKIYNTSDFIAYFTGISGTLTSIKQLMMVLTVIVTALIVVLMERSFISKEKSELALMKAMGISSRSIITQHTLRFGIVSVIACALALLTLMPISNFLMNKICKLIGDVKGIRCDIVPAEIFAIFPAMLIGVAVIGSLLTALHTKTIKASDTASIE